MCPGPLRMAHAFGFKSDVCSPLHFVEEALVAYPCGHNVVLHNLDSKEQELVQGVADYPVRSFGISAMCLAPNRRFIAIAERAPCGIVSIYDLFLQKRRKLLAYAELGSKEILHVCFSADSKLCLTQGGAPDWQLVAWTFDKVPKVRDLLASLPTTSQPFAVTRTSNQCNARVLQVEFCPHDSAVVSVTGDRILRVLRLSDNQFKASQLGMKRDMQLYTYHCWIADGHFAVGTHIGDLLIFGDCELQRVLEVGDERNVASGVNVIVAYSKGFICGIGNGSIQFYEREDGSCAVFNCRKSLKVTMGDCPVTYIAVSPSEECMLIATGDNQVLSCGLNADGLTRETLEIGYLSTSFHGPGPTGHSQIVALDTCAWRPLVATIGEDRSLRVWNYEEKACELVETFSEDILTVSLHPCGLYLCVGCVESLKYMTISSDLLSVTRDVPIKDSQACVFANGGHLFAVASSLLLQIYNTYSTEFIRPYRGHQGRIRSIQWEHRDRKVFTLGADGAAFVWRICDGLRESELIIHIPVQAGAALPTLSSMFCICDDHSIRELSLNTTLSVTQMPGTTCRKSISVSKSSRLLFVGTAEPGIPNFIEVHTMMPGCRMSQTSQYVSHAAEVNCMKVSCDGCYLFSGGRDGSLCMFEVSDIEHRGSVRLHDAQPELAVRLREFNDEILVTTTSMKLKCKQMHLLRGRVEELIRSNLDQFRLHDMKYKERISDAFQKLSVELAMDNQRYKDVLHFRQKVRVVMEARFHEVEALHLVELRKLEQQHEDRLNAEATRRAGFVSACACESAFWDEEKQAITMHHLQWTNDVVRHYDDEVLFEQKAQKLIEFEKDAVSGAYAQAKNVFEVDSDNEILDINVQYKAKLADERRMTTGLKNNNITMKKRYLTLTGDVEDHHEEVRSLQDKERELLECITALEKDIQCQKKEIRERDKTFADKEIRIHDLKKKNQELEKFKFVLDYKIKELKQEIEPRENEIAAMHRQVEEMDLELEQYHRSNSSLDLMVGELRLKFGGVHRELLQQQRRDFNHAVRKCKFQRDLCLVARTFHYKKLKSGIRSLFDFHASGGDLETTEFMSCSSHSFEAEYNRRRNHLERNIRSLQRQISRDTRAYLSDNARLVYESAALIGEMNNLRRLHQTLIETRKPFCTAKGKAPIVFSKFKKCTSVVTKSRLMQLEMLAAHPSL
mmetsp:Transcript_11037/g.33100  ORF Transcript_11037/g.33100 Transcript_11037/m.33100 type:complete len:1188 (+) Transcript_11037:67-3630(+)